MDVGIYICVVSVKGYDVNHINHINVCDTFYFIL